MRFCCSGRDPHTADENVASYTPDTLIALCLKVNKSMGGEFGNC